MVSVNRQAVVADCRAIAFVHEAAQTIVARLAKAPQWATQEGVPIAAMRREVIGDLGRRDAPLGLA